MMGYKSIGGRARGAHRGRWIGGVLIAALLITALPLVVVAADPLTPQTVRSVLSGTRAGHTQKQSLTLTVALTEQNPAALDAFLHDLYDPASPSYHHYLTPAEFTRRFIDTGGRQKVADFLRGRNLTVNDPGVGATLQATGNVGTIEGAFNVQISDYVDALGRTFFANDVSPALPTSIAPFVRGIIGLDNEAQFVPHLVPRPAEVAGAEPRAVQSQAATGCTAAVNTANSYGAFTPNQLATAYNTTFFSALGMRGEGQTVGLVEFDDYLDGNAATFQNCFGTSVPISRVLVDGGVGRGGGEAEVELDIDVIVGQAPRLASLLVYEAPNSLSAGLDMYQRIANDNTAKVISTSWGLCESQSPSNITSAENTIFRQMATQGQSMFAASGDSGSQDCNTSALVTDDPASQPYVTGVGGTTLTIDATTNAWKSEVVWNHGGAGGGGVSGVWPTPAWQTGPGTANGYTAGKRQVPDISADADPYTGYTVYVQDSHCPGSFGSFYATSCWLVFGGTSAAAPLWAAATALTNQYLASKTVAPVGQANPTIYRVFNSAGGSFHDITSGNNCLKSSCGTTYPATAGYDLATGIGSFDAGKLATALAGGTPTPTLQSIAVTPTNPTIAAGATQQFTATGTYSDSNTKNLTSSATWTSDNATVATVDTNGLATAKNISASGTATIKASVGSVSGSTILTVTAPTLTLQSIAVTPANPTIAGGATQQFTATGTYSNNSTKDLTSSATWTSDNATVATVDANGLATAKNISASGTATIKASVGSVVGQTTLTVTATVGPPTLKSITVTPANPTIPRFFGTQQFTATGTYSDGSKQALPGATFTSSNTSVASMNGSTARAGFSGGQTTITATSNGVSGSTTLTVQ